MSVILKLSIDNNIQILHYVATTLHNDVETTPVQQRVQFKSDVLVYNYKSLHSLTASRHI